MNLYESYFKSSDQQLVALICIAHVAARVQRIDISDSIKRIKMIEGAKLLLLKAQFLIEISTMRREFLGYFIVSDVSFFVSAVPTCSIDFI